MNTEEESLHRLYEELLLFKQMLDKDLSRKFYLTIADHINRYNCFLQEINKLSPKIIYQKMDPDVYFLLKKDEERMIKLGIYDQEFSSILSIIVNRVDFWILHVRNMLHVKGKKFVPDEVYKKLPTPIMKIMDEATGCYEHNYLTACAVMLRKALEDSIYLKFRMTNNVDELYDKNKRRLNLEAMIHKSKELHCINSQLADRLVTIKLFGDVGAHSLRIDLWHEDIDHCIDLIRLALDELFAKNEP